VRVNAPLLRRCCATAHKKSGIDESSHRLPASLRTTEHGRWGIIARSCTLLCRCTENKRNRAFLHLCARLNMAYAHKCAVMRCYTEKKKRARRKSAPAA